MKLKLYFKLLIVLGFLLESFVVATGSIDFGSRDSAIKIGSGTEIFFNNALTGINGTIHKESRTANISGETVTFAGGRLFSSDSESILTAIYNPAANDTIQMTGNHKLRAQPGEVLQKVTVSGENNIIEGQPTFYQTIDLQDANSTLTLSLQSKLNQNIKMNWGTLKLGDDLKLGDGVILDGDSVGYGRGTVWLNNKKFSFGGTNLNWTSTIFWDGARDMELNSKVSMRTTWTFFGESHLNGNGNILDLTSGGTLWIKHDTTLYLTDIKIRGLGWGSGNFILEDKTSQIRMSNVELEMDGSFTITEGGIYVEGPTRIVTKSNLLTFDLRGSLTVDGVTLYYDPLNYGDSDNIQPEPEFDTDSENKNITLVNGGVVRLEAGEGEGAGEEWGDLYYNNAVTVPFTTSMYLSVDRRRMFVNEDVTINGQNHTIYCSKDTGPLFIIAAGKTLRLTNVVLKDFSNDHVTLGSGSDLIFGDGVVVELGRDETISGMHWKFEDRAILNGNNHRLSLPGSDYQLRVMKRTYGGALLLENIEIHGIKDTNVGGNITCMDSRSTLSFSNVIWEQDALYTFSTGYFTVKTGLLDMKNTYTFAYQSFNPLGILQNSTLKLDTGFTFSYAPTVADRTLIQMTDRTSQLFINGATLQVTTTGLQLITGTLVIDHKNLVYNNDSKKGVATSLSEALIFGNGTGANDLRLEVMPGGSINIKSGILDFRNAEDGS